jgi:hypothetical protein
MYLKTYDNDFIGTKQNETTAIGTKIKTTSINVKAFREIRVLEKTATNSATNKKETLESRYCQGFQM